MHEIIMVEGTKDTPCLGVAACICGCWNMFFTTAGLGGSMSRKMAEQEGNRHVAEKRREIPKQYECLKPVDAPIGACQSAPPSSYVQEFEYMQAHQERTHEGH
jgi:hypothetical protein